MVLSAVSGCLVTIVLLLSFEMKSTAVQSENHIGDPSILEISGRSVTNSSWLWSLQKNLQLLSGGKLREN